jgi:hypothetical protein
VQGSMGAEEKQQIKKIIFLYAEKAGTALI